MRAQNARDSLPQSRWPVETGTYAPRDARLPPRPGAKFAKGPIFLRSLAWLLW